jgi:hypothetical protein
MSWLASELVSKSRVAVARPGTVQEPRAGGTSAVGAAGWKQ